MQHRVAAIGGDGIGPEIVDAAVRLLDELGEFSFETHLMGGCSIDAFEAGEGGARGPVTTAL